MTIPEPAFSEPWHAQLFALTVSLNESGRLDWPDWAAAFSETLHRHGMSRDLDGGNDYFAAWLETLEDLLLKRGIAGSRDLKNLRKAWEDAYLSTPHGQPVKLSS